MFSPPDMICHAAAHLIADGDLAGGLRNLWDIDQLLRHFAAADPGFWDDLATRAAHHGLTAPTQRAMRLATALFGTSIPTAIDHWDRQDRWYVKRILARDDWGRETAPFVRLIFYIRSHLLRMPLPMLLRHLWVKWRRA